MANKATKREPTFEDALAAVRTHFGDRCAVMVRWRPNETPGRSCYAEISTAYPNPIGANGATPAAALLAAFERCKAGGM
jgi:hypothetical protein